MGDLRSFSASPLAILPGDLVRQPGGKKGTTVETVARYVKGCGKIHVNRRECYDPAATVLITRGT